MGRDGAGGALSALADIPRSGLRLQTLLKATGEIELSLVDMPVAAPAHDEVLLRVEAAPINPSDLGQLFAAADLDTLRQSGTDSRPVVTASVPPSIVPALAARVDVPMGAGNEGAGVVVAAGASPAAQALLGRTVATFAGEMYAQFRSVPAAQCMALPDGSSARFTGKWSLLYVGNGNCAESCQKSLYEVRQVRQRLRRVIPPHERH